MGFCHLRGRPRLIFQLPALAWLRRLGCKPADQSCEHVPVIKKKNVSNKIILIPFSHTLYYCCHLFNFYRRKKVHLYYICIWPYIIKYIIAVIILNERLSLRPAKKNKFFTLLPLNSFLMIFPYIEPIF